MTDVSEWDMIRRHLRFHHVSEPLKIQISFRRLIPKNPRRAKGTLASSLNAISLMYLRMCAKNIFLSERIPSATITGVSKNRGVGAS